ncbi:hypothetical protein AGMMS50276_13300 [Synergistales bacterium]|nr:hypothetical protein AGMMS50276_13300 [Synergistales bacterium]
MKKCVSVLLAVVFVCGAFLSAGVRPSYAGGGKAADVTDAVIDWAVDKAMDKAVDVVLPRESMIRDVYNAYETVREISRVVDSVNQIGSHQPSERAKGGAKLGSMGGAAAGAAIGSVIPVVGTAIGAGVGAVVGAISGAFWAW